MNILFLSDIHLDNNSKAIGRDLIVDLVEYINEKNPHILVIAGDISSDYKTSINVLDIIEEKTGVKTLFIPGNHDIWVNSNEKSWTAYEKLKKHKSSLIDKPYHANDEYVIIGDMGWYDYSFGPSTIPQHLYWSKKKRLWNDGNYALWQRKDEEVLDYVLKKLALQLEKNKEKKVIFVNHFIPFEDFIIKSESDNNWNMCNGYMGSKKIGDLIKKYPNIEWVVFGHTHKKYGVIEDYKGYNFICQPIGYAHEWKEDTFMKELNEYGTMITI